MKTIEIRDYQTGELLMTRKPLLVTPWGLLAVHVFHKGDVDRCLHDHSWGYTSLVLMGGYYEIRPVQPYRTAVLDSTISTSEMNEAPVERVWIGPGSIVRRPARWAHRVELKRLVNAEVGRPLYYDIMATTLIWLGRKERQWGFYTDQGWIHNEVFKGTDTQARM